jgi:hypothetical protein
MILLRERLSRLSEVFGILRKILSFHNYCPWWPVAVAALLEVAIFGWGCRHWMTYHRGVEWPGTSYGEGMIICGDGLGYYAWLRSALVDGDWDFANEFDEHNPLNHWVPDRNCTTPIGRRGNPYPIGMACVWAPAVITTHAVLRNSPLSLPWPADGYSLPYQLAVGLTTLSASLLGLVFLYGICRHYANARRAALAAASLYLGTTIAYYGSVESSMAHAVSMSVIAGLIWYWLHTYGSLSARRWLLLGVLVGLAALLRTQLTLFASLPAGEALFCCVRTCQRRDIGRGVIGLCLAGLTSLLVFTPQLYCWHCVYGHWLATPQVLAHNWYRPAIWSMLFSTDRSLFFWTPITLIACIGMLFYSVKLPSLRRSDDIAPGRGYQPLVLLAGAFALQVYFLGSVLGPGVYLGAAYGFRLLTEAVICLAPGLALLLGQKSRFRAWLLAAVCCVLVAWNMMLMRQYCLSLLPTADGASLATMIANVPKALHRIHGREAPHTLGRM